MLSAKIGRVEAKVDGLSQQLEVIARGVEGLRRDRITEDFDRLRTAVEQMDEGWKLADPVQQWRAVARDTHALANSFERRAAELLQSEASYPLAAEPFLEAMSLASSTRVASRMAAGDDVVARQAASEGASALVKLGSKLRTGDLALARLRADKIEPGSMQWREALDRATDDLRPSMAAVREREAAAAFTTFTLAELDRQRVGGRQWLEMARAEDQEPLLCLLPEPLEVQAA